jgi:hypothetical protein
VSRRPDRPVPWRLGDLLGLYVTVAIGAILLLLAWWGASGTGKFSSQIAWVNVGIFGLVVAGSGGAVWLLTGRRAVGERAQSLLPLGAARFVPETDVDGDGAMRLVASPRMTRYHRDGCQLIVGKNVRPASEAEHRAAERRPCGMCLAVAEPRR